MGEIVQMRVSPEFISDTKLTMADYPVGRRFNDNVKVFNLMYTHLLRVLPPRSQGLHTVCFWVRGSSGCCIASYLSTKIALSSLKVKTEILIIRKSGESSHDSQIEKYRTEGVFNIIVDDFVNSGETLKAIYKGITDLTSVKNPVLDLLLLTASLDKKYIKDMFIKKVICQRYF